MSRVAVAASLTAGFVAVSAASLPPHWSVAVFPSGAAFGLELAIDPAEHARGYMFRDSVGTHEGMLFLFEESGRHSFWMKNCRVALDMIWLDESMRVVDIAREQAPCPATGPCPSIVPLRAARYVLEVAGGTAARERLQLGDVVTMLEDSSLP
ncbi:MAG TPA: DUF192 domain-containing protein [Candidatus Polarisedimenticolaceae bacterium]|nr:DUF192 domain-containing protein [Candidatus Polarisedimenticolaceae bacterium]